MEPYSQSGADAFELCQVAAALSRIFRSVSMRLGWQSHITNKLRHDLSPEMRRRRCHGLRTLRWELLAPVPCSCSMPLPVEMSVCIVLSGAVLQAGAELASRAADPQTPASPIGGASAASSSSGPSPFSVASNA